MTTAGRREQEVPAPDTFSPFKISGREERRVLLLRAGSDRRAALRRRECAGKWDRLTGHPTPESQTQSVFEGLQILPNEVPAVAVRVSCYHLPGAEGQRHGALHSELVI